MCRMLYPSPASLDPSQQPTQGQAALGALQLGSCQMKAPTVSLQADLSHLQVMPSRSGHALHSRHIMP